MKDLSPKFFQATDQPKHTLVPQYTTYSHDVHQAMNMHQAMNLVQVSGLEIEVLCFEREKYAQKLAWNPGIVNTLLSPATNPHGDIERPGSCDRLSK